MSKINIGVLGCSDIAQKAIIPAILELDDCYNLIGIASRSSDRAATFAKKFATQVFDGYDTLIQNKNLDAIYIPLPNSLHYEWIKKSLNQGLSVLVEKSMACKFEQVNELNELARIKNLVLIENFQFRFHPQLALIKDIIDSGKIGELRNISSSFGFPPFTDENNIRYDKDLGGGALLDVGAYPIKISQIIMGDDIYVSSASLYVDPALDVDIWGSAFLKQKNGNLTAQISFGFDHHYQCNLEIWGSKGFIVAPRIFTAPPNFEAVIELQTNTQNETIKVPLANHYKKMLDHFYAQFMNRNNLEDEFKQNISQARLLDELKKVS